jgi:hypothetical protein
MITEQLLVWILAEKGWLDYIFDTLPICLILVPITFCMQFMFVR